MHHLKENRLKLSYDYTVCMWKSSDAMNLKAKGWEKHFKTDK